MPAAAACATSRTATYRRRQPERTVLYRTMQTHLATWLELPQDESGRSVPAHVEREFRRYLECGILAQSRLPPILPTTSFRAYRFDNGCFRYQSVCVTSYKPTPQSRTWPCLFFSRR